MQKVVLLLLCALVCTQRRVDAQPACGTYDPGQWYNAGFTASVNNILSTALAAIFSTTGQAIDWSSSGWLWDTNYALTYGCTPSFAKVSSGTSSYTVSFTYNNASRLTKAVFSTGETYTVIYKGDLVQQVRIQAGDRTTRLEQYSYDSLSRIVSLNQTEVDATPYLITYVTDPPTARARVLPATIETSIGSENFLTTFAYRTDPSTGLLTEVDVSGSGQQECKVAYGAVGAQTVSSVKCRADYMPTDFSYTYTYNLAGQVTLETYAASRSTINPPQTDTTALTYDPSVSPSKLLFWQHDQVLIDFRSPQLTTE